MADEIVVRTRRVTRDKLAEIFKSHELIKAFENITQDVAGTLPDAIEKGNAIARQALQLAQLLQELPFIVAGDSPDVPNARALSVGSGLILTDNGAGESIEIDIKLNGAGAVLASDISEDAEQFVDAPGMSLTLAGNAAYLVDGVFTFQSDAAVPTVGLGFALPSGATISGKYGFTIDTEPLTGAPGTAGAVAASGAQSTIAGQWLIKTGSTSGIAQLRFKSLLATYPVTLKASACTIKSFRIT